MNNKKILLIGNRGYVGSALQNGLSEYNLECVDICWFNKADEKTIVMDYNQLNDKFLESYDVVILMAGHSSVKMCEGDLIHTHNNNVRNFINLLDNLNKKTKFIYASSSSVYGKCKDMAHEYNTDFAPYNNYDITKHIIDLYVDRFDIEYYGLRFGTVNGYAPLLRKDLMINSMYTSAMNEGEIKLYIKDIMRPILGINDLVSGVKKIIESTRDVRGIYNMASFAKTAEMIAYTVGSLVGKPVVEYKTSPSDSINSKLQTTSYDFKISTAKFESNFNFKFVETIESIVMGLQGNAYIETMRDKQKTYE
jgi:nucleoside-diphosphate-sugar epimerase